MTWRTQCGSVGALSHASDTRLMASAARLSPAYDAETGRNLWTQTLGTIQKAPLVFADGKIYVGTESGKFFIVRPSEKGAQVLSEVEMPHAKDDNAGQTAGIAEPIFAGAALIAWGPAVCFLVNGLSFFAVIVAILLIRSPAPSERDQTRGVLDDMKEGFRFVTSRPKLLTPS